VFRRIPPFERVIYLDRICFCLKRDIDYNMARFAAFVALGGIIIAVALKVLRKPYLIKVKWDECWGDEAKCASGDETVRPFPISVGDDALERIYAQLKVRTRATQPDSAFSWGNDRKKYENRCVGEYGLRHSYFNDIMSYWENEYDWKAAEREMNTFHPSVSTIDGLDIMFYKVEYDRKKYSDIDETDTILFLHGWPGSVVEAHKLIPLLTDPAANLDNTVQIARPHDVIVPALPGYGFSDAAVKPGMSYCQMGVVMIKLMERLEIDSYIVQGGDWGSLIAQCMTHLDENDAIKGIHVNFSPITPPLWSFPYVALLESDADEKAKLFPLSQKFGVDLVETMPYFLQQATAPDTLGATLSSGPSPLAAWVLDKFCRWTDAASNISKDELITNLMLYAVTGKATSAARLYKESYWGTQECFHHLNEPIVAPTGISDFPHEMHRPPTIALGSKYKNLIYFAKAGRGGHFAAMEAPEILASHIHEFCAELKKLKE